MLLELLESRPGRGFHVRLERWRLSNRAIAFPNLRAAQNRRCISRRLQILRDRKRLGGHPLLVTTTNCLFE